MKWIKDDTALENQSNQLSLALVYAGGHQTAFTAGRITARLAAAGRVQIENRYTIYLEFSLIRIERNKQQSQWW